MKHDDIVLELNNEKLILLLNNKFGEKNTWTNSNCWWIIQEKIDNWNIEMIKNLPERTEKTTIKELKENQTKAHEFINNLSIEKSLTIEKTFEFPIVKGEAQYKCTKGFIDLIVHCKPIQEGLFYSYLDPKPIEFIIEIKKEKDFNDFGSILRQIKEYKEYYDGYGVKRWTSNIILINDKYPLHLNTPIKERVYCVLSTKIPFKIKELFEEEGIMCLELDSLKKEIEDERERIQS